MAAFWAEQCGDLVVGSEESLGMTRGFEPTHDLFSSPRVTMGRFDPVVQWHTTIIFIVIAIEIFHNLPFGCP